MFLKATCDIPAGAEVLVGYGSTYWDWLDDCDRAAAQLTLRRQVCGWVGVCLCRGLGVWGWGGGNPLVSDTSSWYRIPAVQEEGGGDRGGRGVTRWGWGGSTGAKVWMASKTYWECHAGVAEGRTQARQPNMSRCVRGLGRQHTLLFVQCISRDMVCGFALPAAACYTGAPST